MTRPQWIPALLILTLVGGVVRRGDGAEVLPRADVRFADKDTAATPDFQRHVLPLMGRQGCNGRACHGSFEG